MSIQTVGIPSAPNEQLLAEKVYFLNKSRSKFVAIGVSPTKGFHVVIKLCSTKNNHCVQFTEFEWMNFWQKEGMIANCFAFQNVYDDVLWELEKSYKFDRINHNVVLKVTDVPYNSEVYLGKVSFWRLQEVKELIYMFVEELKIVDFSKAYEEFKSSLKTRGCVKMTGEAFKVLDELKARLPFLAYLSLREYVLFYPDLVEKDFSIQYRGTGTPHPNNTARQ